MSETRNRARAAPTAADRNSLSEYFQEAANLRLCLAYNQEDYEFARAGGRIVYVFDANIFRFFMDPEEEDRHVTPFRTRDLDYAAATALITAEFLFSRELSGQGGMPAYIAPGHGEEIAEYLTSKLQRHRGEGDAATDQDNRTNLRNMLTTTLDKLSRGETMTRREVTDSLRRLVPHLAEIVMKDWGPVTQLRRLYDEDLVRPLALHTAATHEIIWPERARVSEWTRRIRQARKGSRATPRNDERDAEAIVQVMALNAAAASAGDSDQEIRYVFVTADGHVFDAYAEWFFNENPDRRTAPFILRKPLQYVPILNSMEMPNNVFDTELSRLATDALDSLFSNLKAVESSYPEKLPYYRILARDETIHQNLVDLYGVDPLVFSPEDENTFLEVRDHWHRSFRTGVLLNVNLMQRRLRAEFDRLLDVLNSDAPLRQVIEDDQHRNLESIQLAHAVFATRLNIASLLEQAIRPGADGGMIPRSRLPFLLRTGTSLLPPGLDMLLAEHPDEETSRQLIRSCVEAMNEDHDASTLLASAAVAFRCGHWVAARLYARHCLDMPTASSLLLTEAEYILAASIRHALEVVSKSIVDGSDLLAAEIALEQTIHRCDQEDDPFGKLRAQLEQFALLVTVQRRAALLQGDWPEMRSAKEIEKHAPSFADALFRLSELEGTPEFDLLVETLARQGEGLALASFILATHLVDGLESDGDVMAALKSLDEVIQGSMKADEAYHAPIMDAYRAMALRSRTGTPIAERLAAISEVAEADPWSTELERLEIKRLYETARNLVPVRIEPGLMMGVAPTG